MKASNLRSNMNNNSTLLSSYLWESYGEIPLEETIYKVGKIEICHLNKPKKWRSVLTILSKNALYIRCDSNKKKQKLNIDGLMMSHFDLITKKAYHCLEFSNLRVGFMMRFKVDTEKNKRELSDWYLGFRKLCILTDFYEDYELSSLILHKHQYSFWKAIKKPKQESIIQAVKIFEKSNRFFDKKLLTSIKKEMRALSGCDHINVCILYEVYEDEKCIYIVMELIEGKTLGQFSLKNIEVSQIKSIMLQLLRGTAHLHSNNIIHRDLNPNNVIVTQIKNSQALRIKIIDFGNCWIRKLYDEEETFQIVENPGYVAPELLDLDNVLSGSELSKSDVFSLGILFFRMLTGKIPAVSNNTIKITSGMKVGAMQVNFIKKNPTFHDLILKLTHSNPKQRISAEEAINHSFFKDLIVCQNNILKKQKSYKFYELMNSHSAKLLPNQTTTASSKIYDKTKTKNLPKKTTLNLENLEFMESYKEKSTAQILSHPWQSPTGVFKPRKALNTFSDTMKFVLEETFNINDSLNDEEEQIEQTSQIFIDTVIESERYLDSSKLSHMNPKFISHVNEKGSEWDLFEPEKPEIGDIELKMKKLSNLKVKKMSQGMFKR